MRNVLSQRMFLMAQAGLALLTHLLSIRITSMHHYAQFIPCWGWNPGLCMSKESALSYSLLSDVLKLQFCALTQIYLISALGAGPRNLFS